MPGKHPKDYSVDEVCLWLFAIDLGDKADAFRNAGIDGGFLVKLESEDFKELGLSSLQGKKVLRSIETSAEMATGGGGGGDTAALEERIRVLEQEHARLQAELDRLRPPPAPAPAPPPAPAPAPPRNDHHVVKGAAGGAAKGAGRGAVAGAIAGDAGQGAKIGAATGATAGAMQGVGRRRRARMARRY